MKVLQYLIITIILSYQTCKAACLPSQKSQPAAAAIAPAPAPMQVEDVEQKAQTQFALGKQDDFFDWLIHHDPLQSLNTSNDRAPLPIIQRLELDRVNVIKSLKQRADEEQAEKKLEEDKKVVAATRQAAAIEQEKKDQQAREAAIAATRALDESIVAIKNVPSTIIQPRNIAHPVKKQSHNYEDKYLIMFPSELRQIVNAYCFEAMNFFALLYKPLPLIERENFNKLIQLPYEQLHYLQLINDNMEGNEVIIPLEHEQKEYYLQLLQNILTFFPEATQKELEQNHFKTINVETTIQSWVDKCKWKKFFEKSIAADLNHISPRNRALRLYSIGSMYYKGYGTSINHEQAYSYLSQIDLPVLAAIDAGFKACAQLYLGEMYLMGWGTQEDCKLAFNILSSINLEHFALEENKLRAQYRLGEIYYYREATPQDHKKAFDILSSIDFNKLKHHYKFNAQAILGEMYYFGTVTPTDYKKAFDTLSTIDLNQVPQIKHQTGIRYLLGMMHYFGDGTPQDYNRAFNCFANMLPEHLPTPEVRALAQFLLSSMYFMGKGTLKNYKKAFDYLSSIQLENLNPHNKAIAQYRLGIMYFWGRGTEKNHQQALAVLSTLDPAHIDPRWYVQQLLDKLRYLTNEKKEEKKQ